MPNLENEIAATYAELFFLKHGRTLAEDFGMEPKDNVGIALKAVETFRALADVGDEDCSKDEEILAHLRTRTAELALNR